MVMRTLLCTIVVAILVVSDIQARKKHKFKKGCPDPQVTGCPLQEVRIAPESLEQNITELWRHVDSLSNPIHIHVHGDRHDSRRSHDMGHAMMRDEWDQSPQGHAHKHASRVKSRKSWHKTPERMHNDHHAWPRSPGRKHSRKHASKRHGHVHEEGQGPFNGHNTGEGYHYRHGGHPGFGHDTHLHIHVTVDEPGHRCMHHGHERDTVFAACNFMKEHSFNQIEGTIFLRSKGHDMQVAGDLSGFVNEGTYSLHVHEFGDLTDGCDSLGDQYQPHANHSHDGHHHTHGDQSSSHELGQVEVNTMGTAKLARNITDASLIGRHALLGRSIVIQEQEQQTASMGKPIKAVACCTISRIGEPMDVNW